MARYYLHLRDGDDILLDPEGREFESEEKLQAAVLLCARDLMKGDIGDGRLDLRLRIDAEDAAGKVVHSLPFPDAIEIISPD